MSCEMPTFFQDCRPKSRKEHRCDECDATIPPGLRYWYAFGVWDGEPDTWRAHLHCARFRDRYNDYLRDEADYYPEECAPFGCLTDHIESMPDDGPWADRWVRLRDWTRKRYGMEMKGLQQ